MKPGDRDIRLDYQGPSRKETGKFLAVIVGFGQVFSGLVAIVIMLVIAESRQHRTENFAALILALFGPYFMGLELLLVGVIAWIALLRRRLICRREVFWMLAAPVFGVLVAGLGLMYGR